LLPVVTTIRPNLLEIAIRIVPRARALFSSVTSRCSPANTGASACSNPRTALRSAPRRSARQRLGGRRRIIERFREVKR
jgi:hypothetical protein